MTVTVSGAEYVGRALVSVDRLESLGRIARGRTGGRLITAEFRADSYPMSTIPTERLTRCTLTFDDGETARIFIKEIRDVVHWPHLHVVPDHLRPQFISGFPWRLEIELYTAGFGCPMPDGMRLPEVYAIDELGPGRAALWMEEITQPPQPIWTTTRFAHAAHLLGRLAARRQPSMVGPLSATRTDLIGPNDSIRMMFGGRIETLFRPAIESGELWAHPTVIAALERTGDRTLIDDLRAALAKARRLIDDTDALPMTYAHGDASPQNLLVPRDAPDTFVAIDPGLHSLLPIGHDLGQLLVGLCHAGELNPDALAAVHAVILPAYLDGLAAEGMNVDGLDVKRGYLTGLLLRSGFTAIPLERLDEATTPGSIALWTARLRLTRTILNLAAGI